MAAIALATSIACGPRETTRPNVLLVSIDTLRPDHLGCYGAPSSPSPAIDALCRESLVFDQAIAHAPSTLPSHASMLTSLLPQHHGASFSERRPLAEDHLSLAETLQAAGYRTASFNDGGQVGKVWGLDQGFDVYESGDSDRFAPIVERALGWLDREVVGEDAPFFLFLHTYEVHHPYTPAPEDVATLEERRGLASYEGWLGPTVGVKELRRINQGWIELDAADRQYVETTYDAEILAMDRAFAKLVTGLVERGLWEETVVVFTSDHGEEFGEHGKMGWHAHTLYDELLKVPLVVKPAAPDADGWAGRRMRPQVRLIDIAPTVLALAGLEIPSAFAGRNLRPVVAGEDTSTPYAVAKRDSPGDTAPTAVRGNRWKLYRNRLFDLQADPGETLDVASGHYEVVERLQTERARLSAGGPEAEAERIEFDRATRERLEALGYL